MAIALWSYEGVIKENLRECGGDICARLITGEPLLRELEREKMNAMVLSSLIRC